MRKQIRKSRRKRLLIRMNKGKGMSTKRVEKKEEKLKKEEKA